MGINIRILITTLPGQRCVFGVSAVELKFSVAEGYHVKFVCKIH